MLQAFREHIRGWVAGVIVAAVSLGFALWGVQDYFGGGGANETIVKINGDTITAIELNAAFERLRQQQVMNAGGDISFTQDQTNTLRRVALQQLIMTQVMANASENMGLRISKQQIDEVVVNMPIFQVDGEFSQARYQQILSSMLYSPTEFMLDMHRSMLVQQVQIGITESTFALPNEVNQAVELVDQKRDIEYFLVPRSRFTAEDSVTEEAIEEYYELNSNLFLQAARASIEYIELSREDIAKSIKVSSEDVRALYDTDRSMFLSSPEWRVAQILISLDKDAPLDIVAAAEARAQIIVDKIGNGQNFADLAREFSDDKTTAILGGTLSWFGQGDRPQEFIQRVSALSPGQISEPFRTEKGITIVKLLNIKEPKELSFVQARELVEKTLIQQKAEETILEMSEKLADLTFTNPDTLEVASQSLNLPIKSTGLFTHEGGEEAITNVPSIINATFSDTVIEGNNSNPLTINENSLVVLRIKNFEPETVQSLDDVRTEIVEALVDAATQAQAQAKGEELIAELKNGTEISKLVKDNNFSLLQQPAVTRQASAIDPQILRTAFIVPAPSDENSRSVAGVQLLNGDYAVVIVKGVTIGKLEEDAEQQRRVYIRDIENSFGQLEYSLYVNDRLQAAKVDVKKPIS